jgi:hypothetical protein
LIYKSPIDSSKFYLSFGAIFCKEGHILDEWIRHHHSEGVQHFFLVDNCNTTMDQNILKKYVDNGLVTLIINTTKHAQVDINRDVLLATARPLSEWLIFGDLDEFYFAPNHRNIAEVIKEHYEKCPGIIIPSIDFGSNNQSKIPLSIIDGNTRRRNYGLDKGHKIHCKVIVRTSQVDKVGIHNHQFLHGNRACVSLDNTYYDTHSSSGTILLNEKTIPQLLIRYNHHRLQSREFFFGIKAIRGDVNKESRSHLRTDSYFERLDRTFNEKEDLVLKNKRDRSE